MIFGCYCEAITVGWDSNIGLSFNIVNLENIKVRYYKYCIILENNTIKYTPGVL